MLGIALHLFGHRTKRVVVLDMQVAKMVGPRTGHHPKVDTVASRVQISAACSISQCGGTVGRILSLCGVGSLQSSNIHAVHLCLYEEAKLRSLCRRTTECMAVVVQPYAHWWKGIDPPGVLPYLRSVYTDLAVGMCMFKGGAPGGTSSELAMHKHQQSLRIYNPGAFLIHARGWF